MYPKIKWLLSFLVLFILSFQLTAQKKGFVSTKDSVYQQGRIVFDYKAPSKVNLIVTDTDQRVYTPQDLNFFGYTRFLGFRDSTIYESAKIVTNGTQETLFLKQHVGGDYHFLELQRNDVRFFYTENDQVTELTKSNYRKELNKLIAGQSFWIYHPEKISFNRTHLVLFFRALNSKTKTQINLPELNLIGGTVSGSATLKENVLSTDNFSGEELSFQNLYFGIAQQFPFAKSNRLRLIHQLSFEQISIAESKAASTTLIQDISAKLNRFSYEITPSIKLVYGRISPYFFIGPAISYHSGISSELFQANFENPQQINFFLTPAPFDLDQIQFGYVFGLGADIFATRKIQLGIEYRHSNLSNGDGAFDQVSSNKVGLKIRIK